jgi:hypothetical protein
VQIRQEKTHVLAGKRVGFFSHGAKSQRQAMYVSSENASQARGTQLPGSLKFPRASVPAWRFAPPTAFEEELGRGPRIALNLGVSGPNPKTL